MHLYRKPTHPYKFKRHKGSFSLHEQPVFLTQQDRTDVFAVHGIHVRKSDGLRVGHIKYGPAEYMRVEQMGKRAWRTYVK